MKLVTATDALAKIGNVATYVDDFFGFTDAQMWTATQGDSGASIVISTVGGSQLLFTTGTTADHEVYLESTAPVCDILKDRPITVGAIFQFTELNTNQVNLIFGLTDQTGVNLMLDADAGPAATYEGALIFKTGGTTLYQVESSTGSTQTTHTTTAVPGNARQQHLRITIRPLDSTTAEVVYEISEVGSLNLKQYPESGAMPINRVPKHTIALANMDDLNLVFGVKGGSATSEVVLLDTLYIAQERETLRG